MKLRSKLILSFLGLAVLPLAVITLYSYNSSLHTLRSTAEQELSATASDMGSRMESVSRDLNMQIQQFAAFEFKRIMALDEKDRQAAMEAFAERLKISMGGNASFLQSLQFTPAAFPRFPPPPLRDTQAAMSNGAAQGDMPKHFSIDLSGKAGGMPEDGSEKDQLPPLFPFPARRLNTEIRSGNELIGKVSVDISSQRLLHHVLMRTQPRQGEIPFAVGAEGKLYATNPNDLKKIQSLAVPRPENESGDRQQVATSNNWIFVTRKDSQSDLTFGIARPIGDRLGDLRRTTVRNMSYGLAVVALALVGIIPLSSRMTRDLTALTREAQNLARGDLTARVQVASRDEFGDLARAFNRMAGDLNENQKRLIEQEKMHKELDMCRKIQEALLPRQSLRSGAIEVKGVSIPAREVGGDFFNYFSMPGGATALLIGDVSGKGLPAALLMANLQAVIQARLPLELDLVKLAGQLDQEIASNNSEAYLTIFLAVLDSQSLRLRYVNAGHNPQLLLRRDGSIEQLQSTGRPIGLLAGGGFQEKSVLLKEADSLFFYTDGLVEAQNEAGEEFGMARLKALLLEHRALGLEGMLANIESSIGRYRGSVEADDDATMMLLRCGPSSGWGNKNAAD
jgi:serine phosphatase RsbU (regulator of sigma subunit)